MTLAADVIRFHSKITSQTSQFIEVSKLRQNNSNSYQSVFSVQIKNCDPFVFGPEFAIESVPVKKVNFQLQNL